MSHKEYTLYTDGACSGNPGRGGWAAHLTSPEGATTILSEAYARTTNNRMELMAIVGGLHAAPEGAIVKLHSDSEYVVNALTKGWLVSWQRNGWKTAQKKPVANKDLWLHLIELLKTRTVTPTWVRGHAGDPINELCDMEAVRVLTVGPHKRDEGYMPTTPTQLF